MGILDLLWAAPLAFLFYVALVPLFGVVVFGPLVLVARMMNLVVVASGLRTSDFRTQELAEEAS